MVILLPIENSEEPVFKTFVGKFKNRDNALKDLIVALNDSQFEAMVKRLIDYRILRHERVSGLYTTHPLIRAHYFTLLTKGQRGQAEEAHKQIKDYYLDRAEGMPDKPGLDDLAPLIEVVHHACQCGAYDDAFSIFWDRIDRGSESYMTHKLGAWETELEIMREFFPGGGTSQEPLVSSLRDKSWILNEVGRCLHNTGSGNLSDSFYERALAIDLPSGELAGASVKYQNLSVLYSLRGDLARSLKAAGQALKLARTAGEKTDERDSLAYQAWVYHLKDDLELASQYFHDAESLNKEIYYLDMYAYSLRRIRYADHLRCIGKANDARNVTQANLEICERNNWPDAKSRCHRVLADLSADAGEQDKARESYDRALKFARSISHRRVLIEALLGRGLWHGKIMKGHAAALSDLTEALEYARAGGYRLYEADARIGLAWAHLVAGDKAAARAEADYARRMSQEMGYCWGKKDADKVLAVIGEH
ncbi:MAG: hypothetical protein ACP5OU_02515 [Methanothrix sp.]